MIAPTRPSPAARVLALLARLWTGGRVRGILVPAMPSADMPEFWTPSRVAAELGVHRQTVHDWMRAGRLRPVGLAWETADRMVYLFDPDDVRRLAREIAS